MYSANIRDEFGQIESSANVMIPSHVSCFFREHGIDMNAEKENITIKQHENGRFIATYTYQRPANTHKR